CAPSIEKRAAEQWAQEARRVMPEIAGAVVFIGGNTHQPELWVVAGAKELTYNTAHAAYRVSAGSFFQVNRYLTEELVRIVRAGRGRDPRSREAGSSSHYIRVVRSGDARERSESAVAVGLSCRSGTPGRSLSPNLPSGKRISSRPLISM